MNKQNKQQMLVVTPAASLSQAQRDRHLAALGLADTRAYRVWCREHNLDVGWNKTWRQQRHELRLAARLASEAQNALVLNCHIRDLGLETAAQYAAWCRAHGFTDSRHKNPARREREAKTASQERAVRALHAKREAERGFAEWVEVLFEGQGAPPQPPTAALQTLYRLCVGEKNLQTRKILRHLVLVVDKRSRILKAEGGLHFVGAEWGNTYMNALYALACQYRSWLRCVEDWKPYGHTARQQFGSLARHLLADYDVPAFLDQVWFEGDNAVAREHQAWFLQIGKGQNIRMLRTPVSLTKMAAHHFLKAPSDFRLLAALRWGQVRGLGGSERLARAVAASHLRDAQADETFWPTIIHWFVNHPELETVHVGPIVDFIFNVKYAPREIEQPDGEMEIVSSPEPTFEMKGRTPDALLRRVAAWHQELAQANARPARAWDSLGVGAFTLTQPDPASEAELVWTIQELLSSRELEAEGRAMNNCVASYIDACVKGESSIWSLRVATPDVPTARRMATIEIDPETRTIVQARGKGNVTPDYKTCPKRLKLAPNLLRQWAAQQGLKLAPDPW